MYLHFNERDVFFSHGIKDGVTYYECFGFGFACWVNVLRLLRFTSFAFFSWRLKFS